MYTTKLLAKIIGLYINILHLAVGTKTEMHNNGLQDEGKI